MFNQKFDYSLLSRKQVDGKRLYTTPTGEDVPSVTTVLDKTKPKESVESLERWRKRVGYQQAQQITTEAANRGTRMHSYLEHYVKTGTRKERGTNPYGWASHAMADVVIDEGLKDVNEIWGIEVPLYFPRLYAGTTDNVGVYKDKPAIIDYKQSNKPKKREWIDDYFLQLVAYALAHNEVYGTDIKTGVVLMCVKPDLDIDGTVLHTPKFLSFELDENEFEKYEDLWWKRLEWYYLSN